MMRKQQKCRLKSEFAFFQSLSLLFLPTYFVNVGEPSQSWISSDRFYIQAQKEK